MNLLAVILNYRTAEMTLDAARALMSELDGLPGSRLTIVDNDSRDGSYEQIRAGVEKERWGDRVEVVASDYNGGFAYGNNFAVRRALESETPPDAFYLLNSDAFPEPGSIGRLLRAMDQHPEAGLFGSGICGEDGVLCRTAFRFPNLVAEFAGAMSLGPLDRLSRDRLVAMPIPESSAEVDWMAGASLLVRREVFEDVGLMDETYFLYYEETDFCMQARRAGWPCRYVPDSRVMHIGSVSTGFNQAGRRRAGYWFVSRSHYFRKNHGRLALWTANVLWFVGFGIRTLRRPLMSQPDPAPPHLIRDFLRHNLGLSPAEERDPRRA